MMPTVNPQINVTLEPQLAEEVYRLAAQKKLSTSRMLRELIIEVLQKHEDRFLFQLADSRALSSKKTISHKDALRS